MNDGEKGTIFLPFTLTFIKATIENVFEQFFLTGNVKKCLLWLIIIFIYVFQKERNKKNTKSHNNSNRVHRRLRLNLGKGQIIRETWRGGGMGPGHPGEGTDRG